MHQRAGQGCRRRRAGLGRDGDVAGQSEFGDPDQHLGALLAEAQRRDDRAAAEGAERPLQEAVRCAQVGIEQRDQRLDVGGLRDTERE